MSVYRSAASSSKKKYFTCSSALTSLCPKVTECFDSVAVRDKCLNDIRNLEFESFAATSYISSVFGFTYGNTDVDCSVP